MVKEYVCDIVVEKIRNADGVTITPGREQMVYVKNVKKLIEVFLGAAVGRGLLTSWQQHKTHKI